MDTTFLNILHDGYMIQKQGYAHAHITNQVSVLAYVTTSGNFKDTSSMLEFSVNE